MLTKYGLTTIIKYFTFIIIIATCTLFLTDKIIIRTIVFSVLGVLSLLILNFFRDPKRIIPRGDNLIVSPADGKIVQIKELYEPEYLKQDAIQISIFMSPLDVHVNRIPLSGTIDYFKYIHGEYLVAFEDKSSERNERTHIGIEDSGYKILFKQIAGTVARRIVADIKVGQKVERGEKFGMIKFGSRVDVIMPKHTTINVKLGQRVAAGCTILAMYTPLRGI